MEISYKLMITLVLSFSLFSCTDKEPEQFENLPGALVATIEGVTYDFSYKTHAGIGMANDTPAVFIYGTSNSEYIRELSITIVNVNGPGTYLIDSILLNSMHYSYYPAGGGAGTSYGAGPSGEGKIIVTSILDDKITGSFMFAAIKDNAPEMIIDISGNFDLNVSH